MRKYISGLIAFFSYLGVLGGVGGIETERLSICEGMTISAVSFVVMAVALYFADAYYHFPRKVRRYKNGTTLH